MNDTRTVHDTLLCPFCDSAFDVTVVWERGMKQVIRGRERVAVARAWSQMRIVRTSHDCAEDTT